MNREGSWKNILVMISISIVMSAALSGCAYNADLANVQPQLPGAVIPTPGLLSS